MRMYDMDMDMDMHCAHHRLTARGVEHDTLAERVFKSNHPL